MRILFPDRVDVHSPHSTIYRKVGKELPHDVFAFAEPGYDPSIDDEINIIEVGKNIHNKILVYLYEYMSNYDIIHTGPLSHVLMSIPASKLSGAKVVHTVHNAEELSGKYADRNSIRRKTMVNLADQVTVVSKFLKGHLEEYYNRTAEVVPNGVDFNQFRPENAATSESLCLFVGRLVERKNPGFIIDIAEELPSLDFKIVGNGPLSQSISNRSESFPNVELIPWVEQSELERLYAKAGAMICPFEREAFGLVLVEAMASGTPVVGLDDGNISNLVQPTRNGVLCEKLSMKEWRDSIKLALESSSMLSPRESIREYAWERVAQDYDRIYCNLRNGPG